MFLNLDKFPIDIKRYDENWKEKLVKSRVYPENQYAHKVFFRQYFFFERSDSNQSLQASANEVTADFFEGCRFKAEAGRPLTVRISRGIELILFFIIEVILKFRLILRGIYPEEMISNFFTDDGYIFVTRI